MGRASHLCVGDRLQLALTQAGEGGGILAQVQLGADEDDRSVGAVMGDLRVPLGLDVLKRRWPHQREADEEDVGLRV